MSLCPEAAARARMTDAEFWCHVFGLNRDLDMTIDDEDIESVIADLTPCPECGERGPCAFDAHGRPMVHLIEHDDT